jgi:hypothetical protein
MLVTRTDGSAIAAMTMGIVSLAFLAAIAAGVPLVTKSGAPPDEGGARREDPNACDLLV